MTTIGTISEYLVLGPIWLFVLVIAGLFTLFMPKSWIQSLRQGVVYVDRFPIRRSSRPLLFWSA